MHISVHFFKAQVKDAFFSQQSRLWRDRLEIEEDNSWGSGSWFYRQLITSISFYRVIFPSRRELQPWALEQTAWFWLNVMRGEHEYERLLVSSLHIPHIYLLVPEETMIVGQQTCLHPGHCHSLSFSQGLLLGVPGWCPTMPWSLPLPLTESESLWSQPKYSAPRRCTRTRKQQPTAWALIYCDVIIPGIMDRVNLMA